MYQKMLQTLNIDTHPATFDDKKKHILEQVQLLFASSGIGDMSMRKLAQKVGVSPSVLYHHFKNKDQLLLHMYHYSSYQLGTLRKDLPKEDVSAQFKQVIGFQFAHAVKIVAVLKFYLLYRETFAQSEHKTLPDKATKHIEEVIQQGIDQGVYRADSLDDAKVIAHSVNGYVLEHFPYEIDTQKQNQLIATMVHFYERSLKRSE